jgi:hypothetical protein
MVRSIFGADASEIMVSSGIKYSSNKYQNSARMEWNFLTLVHRGKIISG